MTSPKPGLVDASTARVAAALRKVAETVISRGAHLSRHNHADAMTRVLIAAAFTTLASELEASGTEKGE